MAEKLTMPTLTILFQQRAQTTIARSRKGVAALIVRDALTAGEAWSLTSTGQIPEKLEKVNQDAIRRVFKGGVSLRRRSPGPAAVPQPCGGWGPRSLTIWRARRT